MRFKRNGSDPKKDREECSGGEERQINVLTRHKLITASHWASIGQLASLDSVTVLSLREGRKQWPGNYCIVRQFKLSVISRGVYILPYSHGGSGFLGRDLGGK